MANEPDAQAAIQALDRRQIDGREKKVNEARERSVRRGGSGGGGGFGRRERW
jgi:hypothetical protein